MRPKSSLELGIDRLSGRLTAFYARLEAIPTHRPEWLTLLLYFGVVSVLLFFHEPWFDEAQAWMIAKYAPVDQMLLEIPHYEGHPPLWHLVLRPFAQMGLPFEWGLKLPNLLIMTLNMYLILFRAPFLRIIRLTLPFGYFFLYQYGVISRNYCLVLLGFLLAAINYKAKNDRPFAFCAALALLCGASAYGILFAAGICIVWLLECWDHKPFLSFVRDFVRSKAFLALLLLLLFAIALIWIILPRPDTAAIGSIKTEEMCERILFRLFYFLCGLPLDATVYDSAMLNSIIRVTISPTQWITGVPGVLFLIFLYRAAKAYRRVALLCIPYLLLSVFGILVYFSRHHIGIVTMFFLFVAWVALSDPPPASVVFWGESAVAVSLRPLGHLFAAALCCMPLLWSAFSAVHEICYNYGYGKALTHFIEQYQLDQYQILNDWRVTGPSEKQPNMPTVSDYNMVSLDSELALLDRNIYYNFNDGSDSVPYLTHKIDQSPQTLEKLRSHGPPDVLVNRPPLGDLVDDPALLLSYHPVFACRGNFIWKFGVDGYTAEVAVHESLLEPLGLFPLTIEQLNGVWSGQNTVVGLTPHASAENRKNEPL